VDKANSHFDRIAHNAGLFVAAFVEGHDAPPLPTGGSTATSLWRRNLSDAIGTVSSMTHSESGVESIAIKVAVSKDI
jgi:hypothetical protein